METMKTVTLRGKGVSRLRRDVPLLRGEDLAVPVDHLPEGTLLRLQDGKGRFVATAFLGRQNRGLGWVLTRDASEPVDGAFFARRIGEAVVRREGFFRRKEETDCFRIFNGEADGIGGLTVDLYGDYLLVNWYSRGVRRFAPEILDGLKAVPGCVGIYGKDRFSDAVSDPGTDSWLWGRRGDFPLAVRENGVVLLAHLNDGAMTGFFPDQREVRLALTERWAAGNRVLNTFSYTGAFSVFARLGGAASTTSVDLANRSRPATQAHFRANGIDPDGEEIIVEDVFRYFRYAKRHGRRFDLIIFDPPSFARAGRRVFRAQKDYGHLVGQALDLLEPGGRILVSTNCALLPAPAFSDMVETAVRDRGRTPVLLEQFGLPADYPVHPGFPEGDYLKVSLYEVP